ncbi:AAA-like domain-containing protein [bacterium]|nr:AAA-like domain-containing protein [bacterium]
MINPYTISAVYGEKLYGRQRFINDILNNKERMILILGSRRIGKTSLLKQIEYVADSSYIAIYLPLDSIYSPDNFTKMLGVSFILRRKSLKQIGLDIEHFRDENLFHNLMKLDESLQTKNLRLFILCDEAEQLVNFDEVFLKEIHEFFGHSTQNIYLILAASQGIYKLHDIGDAFLHGIPEIILSRLTDDESANLIKQTKLTESVSVSDESISKIQSLTDNHPFLIQCLCNILYDDGRLSDVTEDSLLETFERFRLSWVFEDLYQLLSSEQKQILLQLPEEQPISVRELCENMKLPLGETEVMLDNLTKLCYIKKTDGKYQISNYFGKRWLNLNRDSLKFTLTGEYITPSEQLRVLQAIDEVGIASIYDIYISSYVALYKIRHIVDDFTKEGFIKKDDEYILDGRRVGYYSLTREGKARMFELDRSVF